MPLGEETVLPVMTAIAVSPNLSNCTCSQRGDEWSATNAASSTASAATRKEKDNLSICNRERTRISATRTSSADPIPRPDGKGF